MHALCLIDLAFVPGDAGKIFAWRGFQWYGVVTVLVRCWYGVGTVLVRCWYGVGTVLVRCWYGVGTDEI